MSDVEDKRTTDNIRRMLLALAFASNDPIRPQIRIEGHEERDVAYEAGLLSPREVEMSVYSTQKRGRILHLLGIMREKQWVEFTPKPPTGAYYVFLTAIGYENAINFSKPWWRKAVNAFYRKIRGEP